MAVTNIAKKFFKEVRVNLDPETTPPSVPVGTFILYDDGGGDKAYFMTSTGVKQLGDIGSGGGGGGGEADLVTFEMPTDLPDGVADAGKLMKAEGGKAVVNDRIPAVPGTPDQWDLTINSLGVVGSGGPGGGPTFERFEVSFVDDMGTYIGNSWRFAVSDGAMSETEYYVWYNDPMAPVPDPMHPGFGIEVQIPPGQTAAFIAGETENAIMASGANVSTVLSGPEILEVTANDIGDASDAAEIDSIGLMISILEQGSYGTPSQPEITEIQFIDDMAGEYFGRIITFSVADGGGGQQNYYFWFDDIMMTHPDPGGPDPSYMGIRVEIIDGGGGPGDTADIIAQNAETAFNGEGIDAMASLVGAMDTLRIDNNQNGDVSDADDPGMIGVVINVLQQGSLGGGGGGTPGSKVFVEDGEFWGQFEIEAGIHWTVQANTTDEAQAIAQALNDQFMMFDPEGVWSAVHTPMTNVIVITRNPSMGGDPGGGATSNVTTSMGDWDAADPTVNQTQVGTPGEPEGSRGIYIGQLIEVVGGQAKIEQQIVNDYICEGDIANDAFVTGGTDGKIKEVQPGVDDYSDNLGRAIVGGTDGNLVKVRQLV